MIYLYFLKTKVLCNVLYQPGQVGEFTDDQQVNTDLAIAQGSARAATTEESDAYLAGIGDLEDYQQNGPSTSGAALPYKSMVGLWTQTGSTAPTATLMEQSIAEDDPTYAYSGVGEYLLISPGSFPDAEKVYAPPGMAASSSTVRRFHVEWVDVDTLRIKTRASNTQTDDVLANTPFQIRVYQ